jgi:RNA polymerase sigma-70 factor (ECF subfamily)
VQQGDSEAWREFSCRCFELIRQWCRWRHLHLAEADDVVQNSMLVVLKKIGCFRHSGRGSLRAWLRAIAWRCWSDAVARASRSQAEELNGQYELAVDEIAVLEAQYEQLRRTELMKQAMVIVRQRVRATTWQMFYRTALGDECGVKVAADMQVPLYVLYAARARVQRMLQQQVQVLERLEDFGGQVDSVDEVLAVATPDGVTE